MNNNLPPPPQHITRLPIDAILLPAVVKRNMQARQDALEVVELCGAQPTRFWELLAEFAREKLGHKEYYAPVEIQPPFNEFQSAKFERTIIPYGAHVGKYIDDVPCEYLAWLTDGDEFTQNVRRYVKSARFKERQKNETI